MLGSAATRSTYNFGENSSFLWLAIDVFCWFVQGYLYKKSHGLNKEWKKKYVTLLDDARLAYHPSLHVSQAPTAHKYKFSGALLCFANI